ncbi:MAG: DUF6265 family protein [Sphingorhabdus sp.]
MKKSTLIVAVSLMLMSMPGSASDDQVGFPDWMTGAWVHAEGENWADEYWTPAKAGMMIGASRSGKGEKLLFWEHMRIEREADGRLVFWVITSDQEPTRFVAVRAGQGEIIFENSRHGYPQKIRYWREENRLKAQISLIDGSRAVDFAFSQSGQ